MRRLLAILMLTLLPLQFSWAAVASYCMHERAPAQSQHVGHHEHKHEASNLPSKADDGLQASDTFDVDCCLCHGLGIGVTHLPANQAVTSTHSSVTVRAAFPLTGIAPVPPERPQWRSLA